MPLVPGTHLGPYEIIAPLGAGGMGEVYRARDTRLNREIAIKILPDVLTLDPEHLARFEREAQVLGSLNHPNVAQIYGLEESGGGRALVMELVEGQDLSEVLRGRPISLDRALPIALQIAQGLEAAHEHGIIHRDLKPANIKVRDDGTVKLLDFGLAKEADAVAGAGHALDNSPTITSPAAMTRDGVILGTAAYMAPEQARGKVVDKRADIWAFGAVLYEILAGRRAFDGETVTDVLASVVKTEPDWSALPPNTPFLVKRLLRHCLDKDPRQRLGDIRDARIQIAEAIAAPFADVSSSGRASPARSWLAWSVAIMAALVAAGFAAALATGVLQLRHEPPVRGVVRFTIASPESGVLAGPPSVSPDGRRIAFRANQGGRLQLFVRSLDVLIAKPLPVVPLSPPPSTIFWSPDSRRLALAAEGKLKTVDVDTGLVSIICDANEARGGTWNENDEIVFAPGASGPLFRVSAAGGVPTQVTELGPGHGGHRYPTFLPNGRDFIFLTATTSGPQVLRGSLDSRSVLELLGSDTRSGFVPPDLILFVRAGTLFAQYLDVSTMAVRGDRIAVAEIAVNLGQSEAQFSASTDVLLYREAAVPPNVRLAWVDRKGRSQMVPLPEAAYGDPSLSPDGRQLALTKREGAVEQIWMYDLERGTLGKRTFEENNSFPIWSRDAQFVTFTRGPGLFGPLVRIRADGTGQAEPLVTLQSTAAFNVATSWSPDGSLLVFQSGQNIMIRHADGTVKPLLATAAYEREGRFAPDGRWFAYRSDETGRDEVYVQSFPPGNGKSQISTEGGAQPMWGPDGKELFYKNRNKMMKVDVELGSAFRASTPRLLFEIPLPEKTPGDPSRYAVSPDGQRFLVTTTDPSQPPSADPPIQVVFNWREMVRGRAAQR